jgi:TonB family protein
MTIPNLYLAGKRLKLLKRIGRGGQGEIFLLAGEPRRAVKFYTGKQDGGQEAKVKAMVRLGLANTSSLASFPEDVVTLKSGIFAGFTMRLVEGHREIHDLYGVKSRKIYYPKADYRFLVRAAANTARAVGQVHAASCVIGDLNSKNILVSDDATVALIDADSFQFRAGGKPIPCGVGVPEFTAPELQGRSLHSVVRTKSHDQFGLAVTIFQLLFMGRHPYAGLGGGDLTLGQLIARNLFAYSRNRKFGVAPPMGVATLDDFPNEIASAFERAFGTDPAQRPAAMEWADFLQGLESRLSRCPTNAVHFYPTVAKACPWCKMEAASPGAALFLAPPSRPKYAKPRPGAATSLPYPKQSKWNPTGLVAMLILCGMLIYGVALINAISPSKGNQTYANAQPSASSSGSAGSTSATSSQQSEGTERQPAALTQRPPPVPSGPISQRYPWADDVRANACADSGQAPSGSAACIFPNLLFNVSYWDMSRDERACANYYASKDDWQPALTYCRSKAVQSGTADSTSAPSSGAADSPPTQKPPPMAPAVGALQKENPVGAWQIAVIDRLQPFMKWPKDAPYWIDHAAPVVQVVIDRQGNVLGAKVVGSSGYDSFDKAARKIFKRARTLPPPPPELQGNPYSFTMTITFNQRRSTQQRRGLPPPGARRPTKP